MNLTMHVGLLAGVSALSLSGASLAGTATGQTDDAALRAEIDALKAQVAQLSTGDDWLTEQRAEEIRGLVQDVLADADTRASLLQSGMTAGYDNGFVLGSTDGNFTVRINGQVQFRFIYNNQDSGTDVDTNRWGFENTRTKLIFSGNVINPDWTYRLEANFEREGGAFALEDAWLRYAYGEGWSAMAGQFKAPHTREWGSVHSMDQLAIERSLVSYYFGGGRVQGVAMEYKSDQFHFVGSINDGDYSSNSAWSTEDTEWSSTWRFEFLGAGTWDQFTDFTSPKGSEFGWLIGGGLHYSKQEYGTGNNLPAPDFNNDEVELFIVTADASFEGDGWNAFGAFYYATLDSDTLADPDWMAFVLQGGFYFTEDLEGYLRYEYMDFDTSGLDDLSLLTVGINKYWSENVKLSADFGYAFDGVTISSDAASVADITGWRDDDGGTDGQFNIRTQFQLVF